MRQQLEPELVALLRIQEEFDAIRARWARGPGRSGCDLAYANPYDGPPAAVLEALHNALSAQRTLQLQYSPYGGTTIPRRHIAQALTQEHGVPYRWQDIVLTPGAMAALNLIFRSLQEPGETPEVIVVTPCWIDYPLYLRNLGLKPVFVRQRRSDLGFDLQALADAITARTRALIFSQPANPGGIAYSAGDLAAVARLLEHANAGRRQPLLLISDECHRDFVEPQVGCPAPAAVYPHTCTVYSFGKRLFIQGQRIGYVAVSPQLAGRQQYREVLVQLCRVMGFCTPTALMQQALAGLLRCHPDTAPIHARRKRLVAMLRQTGYELIEPNATFFVYLRVPHGWTDMQFVSELAGRGVLVLPSALFHDSGHVRLSVTATDQALERALPVFAEVWRNGADATAA
jgi:aspartate aminotransferase